MFTGHYAPAFALKIRYPRAPLWQLFLATQAIDLLFFLLVPLGVERLRLDHSRPSLLALQLEGMPWSHSLAMTAVYGGLVVAWGIWAKKTRYWHSVGPGHFIALVPRCARPYA